MGDILVLWTTPQRHRVSHGFISKYSVRDVHLQDLPASFYVKNEMKHNELTQPSPCTLRTPAHFSSVLCSSSVRAGRPKSAEPPYFLSVVRSLVSLF